MLVFDELFSILMAASVSLHDEGGDYLLEGDAISKSFICYKNVCEAPIK